jgi:tRNA pseudouridine 55 synthase
MNMLKRSMLKESGFILIDKPVGPTSFGIIARLRRITGIKKIGHAGTLDPAASGLLLCAIGRESTKLLDKFVKMDKTYEADVFLGAVSDTLDREGKILKSFTGNALKKKEIQQAVLTFLGRQEQTPPMYSAKKVGGKKLCDLARQGIEIERKKCSIEIYKIKILKYRWPDLKLIISCSSGTYIRTIADDLGKKLGTGAYLSGLCRIELGKFKLKKAVKLDKITANNWQKYLMSDKIVAQ